MNKSKIIKITGLVGALLSGVSLCLAGDLTQGIGIIAASLSSVSILGA